MIIALVVAFIVLIVFVAMQVQANEKKAISSLITYIKNIDGFDVTRIVAKTNSSGHIAIAINDDAKKVCFANCCTKIDINALKNDVDVTGSMSASIEKLNLKKINHRIYNYDDIVAAEVFQDTNTISKTNRGSQIVGAAVGGVLLGGVGAIVGGLSGSSRTLSKAKKIGLKITVNDIKSPIIDILFLDSNLELPLSSSQCKSSLNEAEEWYGIFKIIMKQSNAE